MRQPIRQLVRVEAVAVVVIAWVAGALLLGLATGAGAVPTAALMALGPLLGGLLLLIMHSLELARRIGNLSGESTRTLTTVRRVESDLYKVEREIEQTFRQLETMQNLGAMLPANDVLPATRRWAASPDLIAVLVDLVISERPSLVVECGSGVSTLWLALANSHGSRIWHASGRARSSQCWPAAWPQDLWCDTGSTYNSPDDDDLQTGHAALS